MSRLSDRQREWIANMLEDALMPYGTDFDPQRAARLIEARLETLLTNERERIAQAIEAVEVDLALNPRARTPWQASDEQVRRCALMDAARIARSESTP